MKGFTERGWMWLRFGLPLGAVLAAGAWQMLLAQETIPDRQIDTASFLNSCWPWQKGPTCPPPDCRPGTMYLPPDQQTEPGKQQPQEPGQQPQQPPTEPTNAPVSEQSTSAASAAPYMFGDEFSKSRISIPSSLLSGSSALSSGSSFSSGGSAFRSIVDTIRVQGGTPAVFQLTPSSPGLTNIFSPQTAQTLTFGGVSIGNTFFVSAAPVSIPALGAPPTPIPLAQSNTLTNIVQSQLAKQGEVAFFQSGTALATQPGVVTTGPFTYTITENYLLAGPGTPAVFLTPGSPGFSSSLNSGQNSGFNIANPSGGGAVGRQKVSEDNNALPRDRIIFDYDFFDQTALNGVDVNRFVFGFEKTFFDGRTSIEVRVPFATTLASFQTAGLESQDVEFGDVRITPKVLAYGSDTLNIGSGLGIYLPTASDARVYSSTGTELIRIEDRSVLLSPYVTALFTPNENLFAQAWLAFTFDANGNPVLVNTTGTSLTDVGRVRTATDMEWDFQLGYWLTQAGDNRFGVGLAPFIELHSGVDIQNPGVANFSGFAIGDLDGRTDELNLALGMVTRFGPTVMLSTGIVVPLLDQPNRSFDFQFGVRLNVFFGAGARSSGSYGVSQF
jgi:hypothetical protein